MINFFYKSLNLKNHEKLCINKEPNNETIQGENQLQIDSYAKLAKRKAKLIRKTCIKELKSHRDL